MRRERLLHRGGDAGLVPGRCLELLAQRAQRGLRGVGDVLVDVGLRRRRCREEHRDPVGQFHRGLAAILQQRAARGHRVVGIRVDAALLQLRGHQRGQARVAGLLHVVCVDPQQLGRIPLRRALVQVRAVEPRHHLLQREQLVVAVAPAQAREVVVHALGQVAVVLVVGHAHRAAALGQLQAVAAQDDGQVAELRQRRAQRAEHVDLPRRVVDVLVAAEHVRDPHVPVVHHHREVVGGHAVVAHDDQVVDLLVADRDGALDEIVPGHVAVGRVGEAHHRLHAGGNRRQRLAGQRAPGAVVAALLAARLLVGLHPVQVPGRAVAEVGRARGEHLVDHRPVAIEALHLVDRALVVLQAQPLHGGKDLLHRVLRGTRDVGVLDAQHELAAMVTRERPRVQRGARGAEMEEARGRRGDAGADGGGHGVRK